MNSTATTLPEVQKAEWDKALEAFTALGASILSAFSSTADIHQQCRRMIEASHLLHLQLEQTDAWARTRCCPAKCDTSAMVQCELCRYWYCENCCSKRTGACDLCADAEEPEARKRNANADDEGAAATKKAKITHEVDTSESEEETWLCVKCGCDMGPNNPRQFCGKHACLGMGAAADASET